MIFLGETYCFESIIIGLVTICNFLCVILGDNVAQVQTPEGMVVPGPETAHLCQLETQGALCKLSPYRPWPFMLDSGVKRHA